MALKLSLWLDKSAAPDLQTHTRVVFDTDEEPGPWALTSFLFHILLFSSVLLCEYQITVMQENVQKNKIKLVFQNVRPIKLWALFGIKNSLNTP